MPPGKRLVLKRVVTKTYPDGRVEKIEDDVAADVGDAWMAARKFNADGSPDVEGSREAVMKILYPHGVDPPAYVSGGTLGGGGHGGAGAGGSDSGLNRTIKAPNFQGTADQKAELLRLRKRKMEMLRRRKKKAEQLRAEAGVSSADLAEMARRAEEQEAERPAKKLKFALTLKKPEAGGAGPSRFKPGRKASRDDDDDDAEDYGPSSMRKTTSRFRSNDRDAILGEIIDAVSRDPNFNAFTVPVTKKALPDYHVFVSRKMDLGTIGKNLKRAGGYASADAWMADVRQIETNAKLYHESDEEVLVRIPAIVTLAQNLVRDVEEAVERRAADLARADVAFDLEKVLGRAPSEEAAAAVAAVRGTGIEQTQAGSPAPIEPPPPPEPTAQTPLTE